MTQCRYLLSFGLWLLLAATALAAPSTLNTYVNQTIPRADVAQIVNGSSTVTLTATTNYVSLATGAAQGTDITGLYCTSNDTVGHNISIVRINGSTIEPLAVAAIAAGTSTALGNITAVNGITGATILQGILGLPVDPYSNPTIRLLTTSDVLKIGVLTTVVTSGDAVSCFDVGGDYQ